VIILIGFFVFGVIAAIVVALVGESRAVRVGERLQQVQSQSRFIVRGTTLDTELQKSFTQRVLVPIIRDVGIRVAGLAPSELVESTRRRLDRAGNPEYVTVPIFISLKFIALLVGVFGALLLFLVWHTPLLTRVLLSLCILAIGIMAPDYFLEGAIRSRQTRIRKSLPDIIDLLVVSAEAGTGLDGALGVVIRRKHGPLPEEFHRLLTEVRLGKSRQDAWEDMGHRVGLHDLEMLIAALRQAEQLGVSIANTLRTQAEALRTRRSMQVRQMAATLSVKMLFPLIFCILPALFIVVLGPGAMSMATGFKGW
jgi:tight adherence protein C